MSKFLIIILLFISCQNPIQKGRFGNFRIITIEPSTFDMPVFVIITQDTVKALKYVQENNDPSASLVDFEARAVTFQINDGKPPIIWIPHMDGSAEDISIINHELLHANFSILAWAGVSLSDSSEEAFTYNYQFLTKQFYGKIK
jgi:hypothetical protein